MKLKHVTVFVSIWLLGLWLATQYAAPGITPAPGSTPGIHNTLNGCLYRGEGWAIYTPWSILVWSMDESLSDHPVIQQAFGGLMLWSVTMVGFAAMFTRGKTPRVKAFGAGGWGTRHDMKRAGLLEERGTVLGIQNGKLLTYDGPEHQLVSGASRSGKGVGHVIPTLFSWPGSVLVYDIKNELWDITAGYRSQYQHCVYFNPTKPDSTHFNPLFEVRKGPNEIRDVQNIVEMLVNPDGSKKTLDVWDQNASQFLAALILHVLYTEPPQLKNIGRVRELLLEFDATCEAMLTTPHRFSPPSSPGTPGSVPNSTLGTPQVYPEIARVAKSLLSQADRFRSSVRGTAEGYLSLWADPIVCEVTSRSDFVVGDLVCLDKPMTLYLQPPPSDADRVRPLIRLILNQIARALMEHRDSDSRGREKKHRLLLLIDEFPTLGKLQFFSENMRQMAGYGLKTMIVIQSFNDIIEAYGPHNTIIDNCHILTAFASADTVTQQRISQMTGQAVEYRDSYSRPRMFFDRGRRSVSQSEHVRPLLQPGDVRTFPQEDQLVFVTGFKPFRTQKLRYFEHRLLKRRVLKPPTQGQDALLAMQTASEWLNEKAKDQRLLLSNDMAELAGANTPSNETDDLQDHELELENL